MTRIDLHRLRQRLLGQIQLAAIESRDAEEMQRIDMIRKQCENLSADRLGLGAATAAIGGDSLRHERIGLLAVLLLQPRILERA